MEETLQMLAILLCSFPNLTTITAMDLVTSDSNGNVEEHQKHPGLERSTKPVQ